MKDWSMKNVTFSMSQELKKNLEILKKLKVIKNQSNFITEAVKEKIEREKLTFDSMNFKEDENV
ncbi:MAG: hypothetical protein RLZZ577_61 [Bacteroidota bacterium]